VTHRFITVAVFCIVQLSVVRVSAAPVKLDSVEIRDSSFNVIKTISKPEALQAFQVHWNDKEKITESSIDTQASKFTYKLDIKAQPRGDRWLYNPDGMAVLLSVKVQPIFRIKDPAAFNALLDLPTSK
jgi:hypothetical protein